MGDTVILQCRSIQVAVKRAGEWIKLGYRVAKTTSGAIVLEPTPKSGYTATIRLEVRK